MKLEISLVHLRGSQCPFSSKELNMELKYYYQLYGAQDGSFFELLNNGEMIDKWLVGLTTLRCFVY